MPTSIYHERGLLTAADRKHYVEHGQLTSRASLIQLSKSPVDVKMIEEIIQMASSRPNSHNNPSLALFRILRAYEQVLKLHGMKPDEDSFYYELLLKISCEPPMDWILKIQSARHVN